LQDDAFLAAMSSVFQGPPVTFANGERAERYDSYFKEPLIDDFGSSLESKVSVRLARNVDPSDCTTSGHVFVVEQGPLKQLIKDSDPKNPKLLHPVGVRVLEQAMIQEIGVEALERQTAGEALTSLTGMPVTEVDIPSAGDCDQIAPEADVNKAVKAVAEALGRREPVLLTKHTDHIECGIVGGTYNNVVYSVLDAKPAVNGTGAQLVVNDPRGLDGDWPFEPGSDAHSNDTAIHKKVLDFTELGESKLSFGKHEDRSHPWCG
jgi:hypothetical protein